MVLIKAINHNVVFVTKSKLIFTEKIDVVYIYYIMYRGNYTET